MTKFFLLILFTCLPLVGKASELLLYYHPRCPYCQYVLKYLDETQRRLPMVDLQQYPKERTTLKAIGGKAQVPCLIIDGKALYESRVIVDWLKQHPDQFYLGNK